MDIVATEINIIDIAGYKNKIIKIVFKPYLSRLKSFSFIEEFVTYSNLNTILTYHMYTNSDILLSYHLDTNSKYDSVLS